MHSGVSVILELCSNRQFVLTAVRIGINTEPRYGSNRNIRKFPRTT
jgi:hypothetical protein